MSISAPHSRIHPRSFSKSSHFPKQRLVSETSINLPSSLSGTFGCYSTVSPFSGKHGFLFSKNLTIVGFFVNVEVPVRHSFFVKSQFIM